MCLTGRSTLEYHKDCLEILQEKGEGESSEYSIYMPKTNQRKRVSCDMKTEGGGWTVLR